jgi:hypothetical protein
LTLKVDFNSHRNLTKDAFSSSKRYCASKVELFQLCHYLEVLKIKNLTFFACFFNAWMCRVDFLMKKLTFNLSYLNERFSTSTFYFRRVFGDQQPQ